MSKKKNKKKSGSKSFLPDMVGMLDALPGVSAILKPMRKAAKMSGYTKFITG